MEGGKYMLNNLKSLRQKQGLSIYDMAKILSLKSPASYWKKENGDIPFSLKEARILSVYFQKSIDEIFFTQKLSLKENNM